jgi:hypothetical protein
MKLLASILFFSTLSVAAPEVGKTVHTTVVKAPKQAESKTKKAADCDEKAKKPIEIKPESISLSGNTGCSLDEVKP